MRLFVALELPPSWRAEAELLRRSLARDLPPEEERALRWVAPELLHVTLRFLGEFPEAGLGRLQAALDAIEPFALAVAPGSPGRFGAPQRMQVLWLGLDGDLEGLRALAEGVERAVVAAGATPDARPFRPHVTLARVRPQATPSQRRAIAEAVERLAVRGPREFVRMRTVALVRSHLGSAGPRYEVLSRHPRA